MYAKEINDLLKSITESGMISECSSGVNVSFGIPIYSKHVNVYREISK